MKFTKQLQGRISMRQSPLGEWRLIYACDDTVVFTPDHIDVFGRVVWTMDLSWYQHDCIHSELNRYEAY